MFWTEGFITCYKFIGGRSLEQAERILGLPTGEFLAGAYMYEFMRLPTADEFELKGYSQCQMESLGRLVVNILPVSAPHSGGSKPSTYIPSRLVAIVGTGDKFK